MSRFPARGLYAIVDTVTLARRGLEVVAFAEAVLAERPAVVQLRAKGLAARDTLALLRRLVPLARAAGALVFANDRPDLAVLAGCDGVHVGQDDVPVSLARAAAPGLLVGVSTHDREQLARALHEAPDYVAVGPVFPTASKVGAGPVVGLDAVAAAVRVSALPIVAIGGIDAVGAVEIDRLGACYAVIGALVPETGSLAEVRARTEELRRAAVGG